MGFWIVAAILVAGLVVASAIRSGSKPAGAGTGSEKLLVAASVLVDGETTRWSITPQKKDATEQIFTLAREGGPSFHVRLKWSLRPSLVNVVSLDKITLFLNDRETRSEVIKKSGVMPLRLELGNDGVEGRLVIKNETFGSRVSVYIAEQFVGEV